MGEKAQIILGGKTYEFPVIMGTENEKAIDISSLRQESDYITLDNGFGNTGACTSSITYLDGEKGILRYRGIPINQIAEQSTFVETTYLLIAGRLPTKSQLADFNKLFSKQFPLPRNMLSFYRGYSPAGHPMGLLSAMVCSLAGYDPQAAEREPTSEQFLDVAVQIMAKACTIAAYSYKKSVKKPFMPPKKSLGYVQNFLHMMFSRRGKDYKIEKEVVNALETLLILHADHEQNCSTSTVRLVGSSRANLFASVSAGVCALWGPLHGGANEKVVEMLEAIHKDGGDVRKHINMAKDSKGTYRLMGFGHRVYKNFDPRGKIIKQRAYDLFKKMGIKDPLLEIAVRLEEAVLKDDYFAERKLYPNVDFYSGLIYKAIGIPTKMFPVMFALGRMPGWIAHWKEMRENSKTRIGRPRQVYMGDKEHPFVPINQR